MESRIAMISIIVEDMEATAKINELLHMYAEFVVGRMGIPYRDKGVHVIAVVLDAPTDVVSTLSGKLGMVHGINVKAVYSKK
ncbi:MAG: iron-only hydrogenase system regulator [Ruminococcaceae bacterium]|nr:iron-only hydrogenase system regulator [Oscillospiraceae bacterium]